MRNNLSSQAKKPKGSLAHMADRWPSSVVARQEVSAFTGGVINEKTLANIDSNGEGPPSMKIGRKRVYEVLPFISWLEGRMEG